MQNIPIGISGLFTFLEPYNTDTFQSVKYTVVGIRTLDELRLDEVDPLNNIYIRMGMTEDDYKDDIKNDIPMIVLKSNGDKLTYIPLDRISKLPSTSGVAYQRKLISIDLGMLPDNYILTDLMSDLKDTCMQAIPIEPDVTLNNMGDICYKTDEEHNSFMSVFDHRDAVAPFKSNKTKLELLQRDYDNLKSHQNTLETWVAKYGGDLIQLDNTTPTPNDKLRYTKKIVIEAQSLDSTTSMGLANLVFYRYNKYNSTHYPVYAKGFRPVGTVNKSYTLMLDTISGIITLEKGSYIENEHFPNIFHNLAACKFKPGYLKIVIELDDIINIKGFTFTPYVTDTAYCNKIRLALYNSEGNRIYVGTYYSGQNYNNGSNNDVTLSNIKDLNVDYSPLPDWDNTVKEDED